MYMSKTQHVIHVVSQTERNASQRVAVFNPSRISLAFAHNYSVYKTNYERPRAFAKLLRLNHSLWSTCNLEPFDVLLATLIITVAHKITAYVDCEPVREQPLLNDKKFVACDLSEEDGV